MFERALLVDYQNTTLWLKYIEMETKNKFVMSARNLYERACQLLPRVEQFWFKYAHMEELLGNYAGKHNLVSVSLLRVAFCTTSSILSMMLRHLHWFMQVLAQYMRGGWIGTHLIRDGSCTYISKSDVRSWRELELFLKSKEHLDCLKHTVKTNTVNILKMHLSDISLTSHLVR